MSAAYLSDDLAELDVVGSAELVRSGKASAVELAQAAIDRIERVDPQLNAVIHRRYEAALEEARAVDRTAPLAGVPVLIKDVDLAGSPAFNASHVYARLNHHFARSDRFTERLQAAGAIILGHTNIPEFTSSPVTESLLHGPCRNPWDPSRSPGGSSGGAAAVVASRMAPAAQSSDAGGSTRLPASATGAFTIKPSRGRNPTGPSGAAWADIANTKSFITRTVRDFAILLDAVAGPDPTETLCAPPPLRPFTEEVGASPGQLRIGVTRSPIEGVAPADPQAIAAVDGAAKLLADLGHQVDEARPDTFGSAEILTIIQGYWPIKVAMRAVAAERMLGRPLDDGDLEPATLAMLRSARSQTMADVGAILLHIRDFTSRSLAWWSSGYDLLLAPMTGGPPPKIGAFAGQDGLGPMAQWASAAPYANITGQPAASVPLHWTPDGLPIGVQLIADIWREDVLLRVSAQLEAARPWLGRRPQVCA